MLSLLTIYWIWGEFENLTTLAGRVISSGGQFLRLLERLSLVFLRPRLWPISKWFNGRLPTHCGLVGTFLYWRQWPIFFLIKIQPLPKPPIVNSKKAHLRLSKRHIVSYKHLLIHLCQRFRDFIEAKFFAKAHKKRTIVRWIWYDFLSRVFHFIFLELDLNYENFLRSKRSTNRQKR